MLESGSDRVGGLDFQSSPTVYEPRVRQMATLEELLTSAESVEKGLPLTETLAQAIQHGSSIGGTRSKALLNDVDKKFVAKFLLQSDLRNIVKPNS